MRGNIRPHTRRFLCCNSLFQLLYIRIVSSFAFKFWKLFLAQYSSPDISPFHHKLHSVEFSPILSVNSCENWLTVLEKNVLKNAGHYNWKKAFYREKKKMHRWAKAKQQYLRVRQWREKKRCTIKLKSKWNTLRGIVNTDLCNGHHKFTAHKSK